MKYLWCWVAVQLLSEIFFFLKKEVTRLNKTCIFIPNCNWFICINIFFYIKKRFFNCKHSRPQILVGKKQETRKFPKSSRLRRWFSGVRIMFLSALFCHLGVSIYREELLTVAALAELRPLEASVLGVASGGQTRCELLLTFIC